MAILFAASEVESFTIIDVATVNTTTSSSFFNPTYSRSAFRCGNTSVAKTTFAPQTELWIHFHAVGDYAEATNSDDAWLKLVDSVNNEILFQLDADNGNHNLEYWNGSSFTQSSLITFPEDTKIVFDIHVKIDSVNGVFRVYKDGILSAEYLGNTNFVSGAAIDQVIFGTMYTGTDNYGPYYSEIIIATEPTIGWHVFTLGGLAAGTTSEWTGSSADIDEIAINYSDFIYSNTADQVSTFNVSDITVPINHEIKAVAVGAQSRRGATGPQNLELAIKTNSTVYTGGNVDGLNTGWTGANEVWPVNPNTTMQWTESEVNAIEVGVKSKT
ncbi:MAG: hypothetical protein HC836_23170 [Richelia sp. RM2_1_2]|nr:hypothetical protein [Richelia sp. RM2_1_2]